MVGQEPEPINVSATGGAGRLEYQTPEPRLRRPLADWPMAFALAFLCGTVHVVCAVIVPVYEAHYRNMGMKLPTRKSI